MSAFGTKLTGSYERGADIVPENAAGQLRLDILYSQGKPCSQLSTSRSIKARIRGDKCRLLG